MCRLPYESPLSAIANVAHFPLLSLYLYAITEAPDTKTCVGDGILGNREKAKIRKITNF